MAAVSFLACGKFTLNSRRCPNSADQDTGEGTGGACLQLAGVLLPALDQVPREVRRDLLERLLACGVLQREVSPHLQRARRQK